jgi:hypothetical protein
VRGLLAALSSAALLLTLLTPATPAVADDGAEAAAREAAARYDARVLDVKTEADRYRVKLLLPSGKVKVVTMPRRDAADDAGRGEHGSKDARTESRRGRGGR